MSCLRYLRLEGLITSGKLPNSIVKLKHLETLDFGESHIRIPTGVWELKQLRHLQHRDVNAFNGCISKSPFCPNNLYSLPNTLQTLMWMDDKYFQPRLLHRLTNLRKLGINRVSDSTIKILSVSSPVPIMLPNSLEVLKLYFSQYTREQLNLSSYQNIVKLRLCLLHIMPNNSEAFPPNLVKLTLAYLIVDGHLLAALKKLPKLRILKMDLCTHCEEKMDLSCDANGASFPQLEVLHIQEPFWLSEVTCTDDFSMPKLDKILLTRAYSPIGLSERLAKLRI